LELSATDQVQVTVNAGSGQPGMVICYRPTGSIKVDGNLNESSWKINQSIGAPNAWDNDAVEIFIDANNNKLTSYDGRDNQLIKGYNSSTLFTRISVTGVQHAWAAIAGGYSVELSIPWSQLGLIPSAGLSVGFDVGFDNADNSSGRNAQYVWWGTINNYQNTSAFGTLMLNSGAAPAARQMGAEAGISQALAGDAGMFDVIITPNPVVDGQAKAVITGGVASGLLQMYDLSGKIVLQQQIQTGAVLDLHGLNKGLYIVKFITGNKVLSKKLLIAQ